MALSPNTILEQDRQRQQLSRASQQLLTEVTVLARNSQELAVDDPDRQARLNAYRFAQEVEAVSSILKAEIDRQGEGLARLSDGRVPAEQAGAYAQAMEQSWGTGVISRLEELSELGSMTYTDRLTPTVRNEVRTLLQQTATEIAEMRQKALTYQTALAAEIESLSRSLDDPFAEALKQTTPVSTPAPAMAAPAAPAGPQASTTSPILRDNPKRLDYGPDASGRPVEVLLAGDNRPAEFITGDVEFGGDTLGLDVGGPSVGNDLEASLSDLLTRQHG